MTYKKLFKCFAFLRITPFTKKLPKKTAFRLDISDLFKILQHIYKLSLKGITHGEWFYTYVNLGVLPLCTEP